ncbi:hypothetical protein CLF_103817 [Clonorchis sinensis]|uniref:Uncharacterized protein n=1 Tax=Clonorchis sinensis TaxID=79923 RepID=G7YAG3_CLOSI|nr:hypothetical protein CLF_103817 [Clonorchis sinensis]
MIASIGPYAVRLQWALGSEDKASRYCIEDHQELVQRANGLLDIANRQDAHSVLAQSSGVENSSLRQRDLPGAITGERQPLNDKNKTDPGNLGESLDPVCQSVIRQTLVNFIVFAVWWLYETVMNSSHYGST